MPIRSATFSISRLALLALLGALSISLARADKPRVAVVDFNTDAIQGSWHYGWSYNNLARAAADNLASELVKTGSFRVIERQQLDKVLAEQDLGDTGRLDPSTAARIGKVIGAQLIIVGAVKVFEVSEKGGRIPQIGKWKWGSGIGATIVTGKSELTARLVDTTTGEVLGAYEGKGSNTFGKGEFAGANLGTDWNSGMASKVLAEAVEKLAKDMANKSGDVSPSTQRGGIIGKVAKVDGTGVFINVGGASGVKVGDTFEIRRVGEQIKDPDTGEVLGGDEESIGTIEITKIINDKLSMGKVVNGKGFASGDKAVMR